MRKSLFYEYYGGHLGFLQNITVTHVRKNGTLFFSYLDHILNQNPLLNQFYQAKKSEITNGPALIGLHTA